MQGAFVNGVRPRTKKALKEALSQMPEAVELEATGMNEYDGVATAMPEGKTAYVVGPDPYRERKWYANVTREGDSYKVV